MKNYGRYQKLYDWKKPKNRVWMDNQIEHAPMWCSVDLRDGNQALPNPMNLEEKITFYKKLLEIGFKEIEIGFPAASDTEYRFTRYLIENNMIPDDVKIQVLTQAREEIIAKTFEAVKGAKNVIVHLYNSTSKIQRDVVFKKTEEEIKEIAINGAEIIKKYATENPETNWTFEYSPESFSTTEMDFALEVVNSVIDVWESFENNKIIINFPATLECAMPNYFADQIAYICENIKDRQNIIVSIHSHNDRGTGVATSEMGLLAGADRIEGALFGNGERTGNADIMNIAMNMYVQGVDPKLDFSNINDIKNVYEDCTKMEVGPRHPYAGELVFTAFSGSHQDAISKGLKSLEKEEKKYWEVPYLPMDPADLNREYESIIRINSQSGNGGVSFILEKEYGYFIPKKMRKEVGYLIKNISDMKEEELTNDEIIDAFNDEYVNVDFPISIKKYNIEKGEEAYVKVEFEKDGKTILKENSGKGPIDAFIKILKEMGYNFSFESYNQDSNNDENEKSEAITYVNIKQDEKNIWAVGKDKDIIKSSFIGIVSAVNRMIK